MPNHDWELHAEGHFQRRFFTVRCCPAATYLGKNLSYQSIKAYPAIFFLLFRANSGRNSKDPDANALGPE
jgi:hypothetical protein